MMADRELLELAAKAAGAKTYEWCVGPKWEPGDAVFVADFGNGREAWNPLESDGDAFRLLAASPYLDTQWWVTSAWQASDTEEGRRAYLRRRIVTTVASIARLGEQNG